VVLTNSDASDAPGLATQVLRIVLELPEREHKEIAVDPKLFDKYLGTYQLDASRPARNFSIAITREGDRLFAQIADRKTPLSPESARDYVLKGSDTEIIFASDGKRRTKELILREGGTDTYLSRIE
jgi:hypothetical protein